MSTRQLTYLIFIILAFVLFAEPAFASGSSMPWEAPLTKILKSIEGPVAKIFGTIVIIMTGLTLAFGERKSACQAGRQYQPRNGAFSSRRLKCADCQGGGFDKIAHRIVKAVSEIYRLLIGGKGDPFAGAGRFDAL